MTIGDWRISHERSFFCKRTGCKITTRRETNIDYVPDHVEHVTMEKGRAGEIEHITLEST